MNPAHLHLILNHVPLYGATAGVILLIVALVGVRESVARAGLVVFVLTAAVAGIVYLTGQPAEELVEDLPEVSESVLEAHEQAARVATLTMGAFGLIALYGLVVLRRRVTPRFTRAALVLSLVPLAAIAWAAYLGGQVRHSEIRPGGAAAATVDAGERAER